ncbi:MAG TPA: hypothetical protein VNF45_04735 [Candidatus Binataceae bacterium]|nr:hypothetical protein [Candidatus Binataceae bacterium]
MSTIVAALYDAHRTAGVPEDKARAAAGAVLPTGRESDLATIADLAELKAATRADLSELKADLIKWNVGTIIAMTAVFAVIVKLL